LVAGGAVLADLVAETLPGVEPNQRGGQQDRHGHRDGDGDEDLSHERAPRGSAWAWASDPRPAELDALTSPTSPGCSSACSNAKAASPSATFTAPRSPHEPP